MSGFWARTLIYLGLREEPEDHVVWDVLESADTADVVPAPRSPAPRPSPRASDAGTAPDAVIRSAPDAVTRTAPRATVAEVRPIRSVPVPDAPALEAGGTRVVVVQLRVFDDVEAAARGHREGLPVLLDVGGAAAPDDRRAIDFLAGVAYVSGGTLRRLTRGAFLMLPRGVDLDAEERARLQRLGYPVEAGGAR